MNFKSKSVLIIGGNGFIGTHLCAKYLDNGFNVTSFDIKKPTSKIVGIKYKTKDLVDIKTEVKNFDIIIDLAGTTDNYAVEDNDALRDIKANCTGTLSLLEACRKYNPKAKIVYASTFFVCGAVNKIPVDEKDLCEPLGLYGATKLCAENFCKIYSNIYDMDISIIRFCNVYGPGEPGKNKKKAAFNYMIRNAVQGKNLQVYNMGDFFRDYIYIDDIINACVTVGKRGKPGEIYFAGNSKFIKFIDLMKIISKETGVKIKNKIPPEFHKRVGIVNFICDNSKLTKIGWKPKVSVEQGIKWTIKYYKRGRK